MDFESVIKTINKLLIEERPRTFNSSWVRRNAPRIYRFIQKKIRIETGGIDWDLITRALNPEFQRQWIAPSRKKARPYRNKTEVGIVLQKYRGKLYTFLAPADKNDKYMRDVISIALVRIAQKGNISAKQEIINLLSFTIDDWIERCPKFSCWRGYDQLIQRRLECCIRCYRYSGSFIGYVFKTLEYAARGLRPVIAYSLDDSLYFGEKGESTESGRILKPENC
jgi:hypothetical protein